MIVFDNAPKVCPDLTPFAAVVFEQRLSPPPVDCAIASTDIAPPPTPAITATAAVTDERIVVFDLDFVRIRAVSAAAVHVPVVAFQTVR
ncbi:hypothetical protein [Burkholderia cepacia]|uniref:hypothetical protein n=1 Tax=Burkholderia cepacia TaxID=292 RepID=UPI001E633B7C|nr:hypothetical protein [Burkholderia cepacia]